MDGAPGAMEEILLADGMEQGVKAQGSMALPPLRFMSYDEVLLRSCTEEYLRCGELNAPGNLQLHLQCQGKWGRKISGDATDHETALWCVHMSSIQEAQAYWVMCR